MRDIRPHLRIHTEPTIQFISRAREQTHGEFALEHQHGAARRRGHGEEFEDERGGDLVGRVGDADVEVGEGRFYGVADEHGEFLLEGCAHDAFGGFGGHAGVHFDGGAVGGAGEDQDGEVAGSGTDFEDGLVVGGY